MVNYNLLMDGKKVILVGIRKVGIHVRMTAENGITCEHSLADGLKRNRLDHSRWS